MKAHFYNIDQVSVFVSVQRVKPDRTKQQVV